MEYNSLINELGDLPSKAVNRLMARKNRLYMSQLWEYLTDDWNTRVCFFENDKRGALDSRYPGTYHVQWCDSSKTFAWDNDYIRFVVDKNRGITVIGGEGLRGPELVRAFHSFMKRKGIAPQTDINYISPEASLDTISKLCLAKDVNGNLYSKYNLPENFHTKDNLDLSDVVGLRHLPRGLKVEGELTLSPDILSIEEDSKIGVLNLGKNYDLVRLPNVADKIVADWITLLEVRYIDPNIKINQIISVREESKVAVEDLRPGQARWQLYLNSQKQIQLQTAINRENMNSR